MYNAAAETYLAERAEEIKTGDQTNPFHAPPMETLVEFSTAIKNSPLYQQVLKEYKMKEMSPQTIVNASVAGIRSKRVTIEQAARGITTIFNVAADYNNTMDGGFRRLGLPNQLSYNAELERPVTGLELLGATTKTLYTSPLRALSGNSEDFPNYFINAAESATFPVNFMDHTSVMNALVKSMSSTIPME